METIGIDEVGRGCWAGPLVAGAVLLGEPIAGLKDSKLLSKAKREQLDRVIREEAVAFGLGWVDPSEIDANGLTWAVSTAMERVLQKIEASYDEIIIDGSYNFLASNPKARTLVKADALIPAVSAASIIAKVARDNYMAEQAIHYPGYGFEKHVGYGTKLHIACLKEFGVCELHRRSYKPIRKLLV